jgi:hypothetical protein
MTTCRCAAACIMALKDCSIRVCANSFLSKVSSHRARLQKIATGVSNTAILLLNCHHTLKRRRVREKVIELCLLLIDYCSDVDMKQHLLQKLQQRLLDETDIRVIMMLIEPNRFKTFCIRIDSLAKSHQQQHRDAMHAYVVFFLHKAPLQQRAKYP